MAIVEVEKRLFLVITHDDTNDVEISRFLRDMDKKGFMDWLHKHLLWCYSNNYTVEFAKATDEDIKEVGFPLE